jgi:hypothetical protein
MKRLLLAGLSIVVLSFSVSTSARAQSQTQVTVQQKYVTPFELVGNAYQGEYQIYSIPGFGELVTDVESADVTAEDLVRAAIKSEDLSPEAINDREYINYVAQQLTALKTAQS